ncbi:TPA: hypothetical protein DEQ95_00380 [Candidatus Beckwithbacteria bacterium]|nr:MAG: hypothetical protein UY43_C0001G0265 [Candidatus Beckwithbacteria bacterium GW2011_GWC1_49_16]KKU35187.1 MAG: hypothetical protein UX50_C0005G0010 [Candidatus Beckwithbacteria bacterium GW2011_GWA1_46_30]KKU71739.1 MAG: hypothetical protein UX97_C0004G0062 [Candidatus Beckwithbacteria bacterium GW2011_GWA2_47_25]KKW03837.1 MAG: hypothetical protein UY37_C0004G0130 [Candidatus Beckwithbacteria bacterium GW2011_GWC2_49_11]OGD48136.1 MAG: hypothetical protein A2877_00340 [Candidatus Beckwi
MAKLVTYRLISTNSSVNLQKCLQKINDYLLTFTGEVEVKKGKNQTLLISYPETKMMAAMKINTRTKQIVLTCAANDNLTVNLVKIAVKNLRLRIYNTKTRAFLVNDPNLLDLTAARIDEKIVPIFKQYRLTPLFQYNNSLVFFAQDKRGQIHLVNRHLLEHLRDHPGQKAKKTEFSRVVAENIGRFVALMDRGLIPINFYQPAGQKKLVINQSGLPFSPKSAMRLICFQLDETNQSFNQTGQELSKIPKNYLAIKINPDVNYIYRNKRLIPELKISVYLDS